MPHRYNTPSRARMAEEIQRNAPEEDAPPMPTHSQSPMTQVLSPPTPVGISSTYSGTSSVHLPPLVAHTSSNFGDSVRIVALEGMVNQLVANMALLRDQNRASSSYFPPLGQRSTVDPMMSIPAPAHTIEHFPFEASQPHISFSYQAPSPLSIPPFEPGTPTQAAPAAPSVNFIPETENEQDRRLKKLEETIKALQEGGSRFEYDYEEFVIQTFQDSLTGSALDWFMTLKAADIPTWTDLSRKFLDQYRLCAETPPTLLDLNMMEMKEDQTFEAYAAEWRGKGHVSHRRRVIHGLTSLRELLAGFFPYTLTGKRLDAEVPPAKPKTKALSEPYAINATVSVDIDHTRQS
ncbi:hypothetical protein CRG98_032478 [Punica granatum]|uniref:Retrotransposon gag domain-containing protein n=1 Tax=Punica granatum TaxID=22663 RepID=A0A2I0IUP1_PUNGR|nr:hypothetical protein CRG98_032478 [Punica granatum]